MNTWNQALEKYLKELKSYPEKKIIGIILFGSRANGMSDEHSDIDLFILTSNKNPETLKGCKIIDGFKVEYKQMNINNALEVAKNDIEYNYTFSSHVFNKGRILFQKNSCVTKLRNRINRLNKNAEKPIIDINNFTSEILKAKSILDKLSRIKDTDNASFESTYYNLLEDIRRVYSKHLNLQNMDYNRIYQIYNDDKAENNYSCGILNVVPDKTFVGLYLTAIKHEDNRSNMFRNLNSLFDYLTADFTLNFNNYQLDGFNQLQDTSVNTDFYNGGIIPGKVKKNNLDDYTEQDWESYFGTIKKPCKKNTLLEKDWESYFGIITKDKANQNKLKTIKYKDDFYI